MLNAEKAQARYESKREQAALKCAAKLEAAVTAMNEYLRACMDCNDASSPSRNGLADSRLILIGNMSEYSNYLSSRYAKEK